MNFDDQSTEPSKGLFTIHGSLDGEESLDYSEDREQFIGLLMGDEEFLLPISEVNEIVMLTPITYVPQAHRYIEGVINLRGQIIPAINIRKIMGLKRHKTTLASRIIIVRFEGVLMALLVDGITYVVQLLPSEIENQNLASKSFGAELISRMSKHDNRVMGILDLHKVVQACGGLKNEDEAV